MSNKKLILLGLSVLIINTIITVIVCQFYFSDKNQILIEKLKTDRYEIEGLSVKYRTFNTNEIGTQENKNGNLVVAFLNSKFAPPITSALISATITILIYICGRKVAKNQLIFDLALKHLLPSVYMPLIKELRNKRDKDLKINIQEIEEVLLENAALINFAPKNIKRILEDLRIICGRIDSSSSYVDNEQKLIEVLNKLELEIIKRFGALVG